MVRQWDYDEWGDSTEASLALEEVLRQWLGIKIVPGAEEQIRHASLGGTRGTEEVGEESDDSEGSDDEKGNDMCTQASGPAASGANAGGTTASGASTDWVFTKRSGRLQILPWKAWQAFYEQQVVAKMPGRERDLHLYHVVFGGASLLDVAEDEFSGRNLLSALRTIYGTLGPQLWSLSEEDVCRCMKHVPPEALQGCSFEEFVDQYLRFREWLRGVSRSHVGREFRTLVRVRLDVLDDTAAAGAKDSAAAAAGAKSSQWAAAGAKDRAAAAAGAKSSHWASPAVIKEAKDFTFIPAEGATVTSAMHGRCRVLEVETRVCNTRLMRFVMASGIMEIQCRRIWHAVRAYHRCALLSVPSESIAETAGSVLRDVATKAAGRPKPVDVFVRAAHIRLAGLRGHGGEEGVLSDALNLYFNARSPEKWHFKKAKDGPAVVAKRVDVERAIRQQELPCWVALPLRQAAASDMTLSKYLPRPTDLFSASVGQRKLASGSNASGTTHKKRREDLDCFRTEHNPGQLPESLWAQLGARITSIASNHRPGVHRR